MHISPSHFQRYFFFFHQCYVFFFNYNFFSLYTIIIIIFLELRAEEKIICLLYFLSFHFSSQQIKKFLSLYFFTPIKYFDKKINIFFFSTFSPLSRFICSHAFFFFYFEKLYTHMFTSPTFSSLSHLILPLYYTLILKSTQSDKRVYGD